MPSFDEYMDLIRGLWDTRWLTNVGALHEELTAKLRKYLKADKILLFSNGHMALELGIQALGLRGEVITTPYTFVSTTQAIVRNGLTPVFCDIDPLRFTMDPSKIEALITDKTSAIVAVHVYGIPCDTDAIGEIAEKYGLKVIYDAAHTFGENRQGESIARYGDISIFSFHATKVFHTVEGGGAVFADAELYDKLCHLRDFGLCPGGIDADQIGANAKLSELHAAMGLCNLRHIDAEIAKRKSVSEKYDERLKGVKGLQTFPELKDLERNYAYYPVVFNDAFNEAFGKNRDEIADELQKRGIMARKYFYPLTSAFTCYKNTGDCYKNVSAAEAYSEAYMGNNTENSSRDNPEETPIAKDITNRVLCLPLYADMTEDDVNSVCDGILMK
jgi:dTDP-4-amino-4,6-dideoxygalactose transaminase